MLGAGAGAGAPGTIIIPGVDVGVAAGAIIIPGAGAGAGAPGTIIIPGVDVGVDAGTIIIPGAGVGAPGTIIIPDVDVGVDAGTIIIPGAGTDVAAGTIIILDTCAGTIIIVFDASAGAGVDVIIELVTSADAAAMAIPWTGTDVYSNIFFHCFIFFPQLIFSYNSHSCRVWLTKDVSPDGNR